VNDLSIKREVGEEADQTVFNFTATAFEPVTGDQRVDLALSGEANADDLAEKLYRLESIKK
jgi:hypothetical protein